MKWTTNRISSEHILNHEQKLTCIGISAMIKPLLSSRLLRITTSPPTTMLITIPSLHIQEKKHHIRNIREKSGTCYVREEVESWNRHPLFAWLIRQENIFTIFLFTLRLSHHIFQGNFTLLQLTTNLLTNKLTCASYMSPV